MASVPLTGRPLVAAFAKAVVPSTGAVALGDSLCQKLEDREEWDSARTARMATATLLVLSPLNFFMALQLERLFPGNQLAMVLKKTGASGLLSVFFVSINFGANNALAGGSMNDLKHQLSTRLTPTLTAGVCYWPLVNMANFRFVPWEQRAVVGSLAGVVWNVYMSKQVNAMPAAAAQAPPR